VTTRPLKFLRLPSAERWLLVRAAVLLVVIRLGLGLLPFHTFRRLLAKLATASAGVQKTDPSFEERVGRAVGVASRHSLGTGTCLSQALAAQVLLTRRGHPALLRIGVLRGQEGQLVAHAWLEGRNRVVVGGSELERYTPLVALEGGEP
jgi:hypothetical protein